MSSRFGRNDFLEALFGDYLLKYNGFVRVTTVRHLDRRISTRYFPKLETLAKEQYLDNYHVFFNVCPYENMKPEKSNIHYLVALWAGLDLSTDGYSGRGNHFTEISLAAKAVRSFPLAPSIVVESGWGVHLYWLLNEVVEIVDLQRVEAILTRLNEYFLCKKPVGIDSALRLPDTFNCRVPSNVVNCSVKYLNPEFRYNLEEFEGLKLVGIAPSPSAGTSSEPSEDMTAASPSKPFETTSAADYEKPFDAEDVEEFIGKDLSESKVGPPPSSPGEPDEVWASVETAVSGVVESVEAIPIEAETYTGETSSEMVVMAIDSTDSLAAEIVDKVVNKLSHELMEKMVDEIVEKLYQRITTASQRK
jgi:hypothetical protein